MHKENLPLRTLNHTVSRGCQGMRELLETKAGELLGDSEYLSFYLQILLYFHTSFQHAVFFFFFLLLSFTLLYFEIAHLKQL